MLKLKKFSLIVLVLICIFSITGCTNQNLNMESKIESEIDFCEGRILIFLKKCEYDEYVIDGSLNWEYIINDTTDFTKSFPTIEADLNNANYDKTKIEEIKTILQNMNNYAENKNMEKLKSEYGNLYSKITNVKLNLNRDFKNKCMQIYIVALTNDRELCNIAISNLENSYNEIKENSEFLEVNKFSLNRIHDNILDLRSSIEDTEFKRIRAHALKIVEIM